MNQEKNKIMKTITILLLSITTALTTYSQTGYNEKMAEALAFYASAQNVEAYENAALKFDLISNGAPDTWLPDYYYTQCYIMMSFNDQNGTVATKDKYLANAELRLATLLNQHPTEAEIYVLQGLFYTATLVVDPANRGQKYSALTRSSIEKALKLEPENPRAKQMLLSNKVGTAQFFNQDLSSFCEEAQLQIDQWDNYTPKSALHPTWGKNQLYEILKNCKSTPLSNQDESNTNGITLTLHFSKIKPFKGVMMAELIDKDKTTISGGMVNVTGENCTIILENLKAGTYAIRYYHDENENKKMDVNKHGIPIETYGFSNNARGFMGEPKFKKMSFELKEDQTLDLTCK